MKKNEVLLIDGVGVKVEREIEEVDNLDDCFELFPGGRIKINVEIFTNYLLNKFTFKTIYGTKSDKIFLYENGIYKPKGEEVIKTFTEEKLNKHCNNHLIQEVIGKIKRKTSIEKEDFENTPINLIPLENGVYNIKTQKLEEHNKNNFFKLIIPVKYDFKIKCPIFLQFLEDTLYPDDINLIQEWFGFCLYRKYLLKKGMIWFGETDTGKTTLLNILEGLIGIENLAGLSLQEISGENNFDLASMKDKSLNSFDDLSSRDLNDGGGFKIATGGGTITGEYKFGDKFKFVNYAKLLFACNKIPSPKDIDDSAYFSRWLPIAFDNQVEDKNKNPLFAEECLKKEKSGIFNWAIIGLKRLLENRRFSFNKTHEEVKLIMCRSGNPISAFVQDKCYEQEGLWISKEDLYNKYCEYMKKNKLPAMTKRNFGSNIKRHCYFILDGKSSSGDERGWRNVRVGEMKYEKKGKLF